MSSITSAGIAAALISIFCTIAWMASAVINTHRAHTASDLAAVAAAHARYYGRDACAAAREVTTLNNAELVSCEITGLDVKVSAQVAGRIGSSKAGPA